MVHDNNPEVVLFFDHRSLEVDDSAVQEQLFDAGPSAYDVLLERITVDDTAILDGSEAELGVRVGDLAIEIFTEQGDHNDPKSFVEVYPLDGKDKPVLVEVAKGFNLSEPRHVKGVVACVMMYAETA